MAGNSKAKLNLYGSIASIIGLLTAICVFWLGISEARKALSIQVLSKGMLFSAPLEPEFRLTYKEQPVQNVASVLLQIRNTGRRPIAASDFEKPLHVSIKGISRIVSVRQIGGEPPDLNLVLTYEGSEVRVGPALFNPGDMGLVAITALCSDKPVIHADLTQARIVGIKKVDFDALPGSEGKRAFLPFVAFLVVSLIAGLLANSLTTFIFSHWRIILRMKENL